MSDPATPLDPAPFHPVVPSSSVDSLAMNPEPPPLIAEPPLLTPPPQTSPSDEIPAADIPAPAAVATRTRRRSSIREYAESLLVTVLLALFGTTFVVQAFKIPSQSMEPTLLVGDHLLVNKFVFGGTGAWYERILPYRPIRRGDIIVFKFPFEDHPHYVKRVIGLPGERIRIVDRQVFINGAAIAEPYAFFDEDRTDPFEREFPPTTREYTRAESVREEWARDILSHVDAGELVVPPGHLFVMGDNRRSSSDSRFWGFVPRDAVMGRPILIYWSVSATSDDYADRSLSNRAVGLADTILHLPDKTRWARMFTTVH